MIALAAQHPDYALGFQDEVWWSRVAQPHVHTWCEPEQTRHLVEQTVTQDDPDPKALACYGLLVSCPAAPDPLPEKLWLRFIEGRPLSAVTTHYLAWCCEQLAQAGKTALLMVWDNASWPTSQAVRSWIHAHNQHVRQRGQGVRIVPCYLPSKSPWLNRIEPHWAHGKRNILEPARLLSAQELVDRICAYFACDHLPHLSLTEALV